MTNRNADRIDELAELRRLADDIFAAGAEAVLDVPDTAIDFDPTLWKTLTDSGLTLLTTPESAGGSGATPADLSVVLAAAARHAAPVPLAETDLLASWLLRHAGLSVPEGPLTAAYDSGLTIDSGRVRGRVDRVPWARAAGAFVLVNDHSVALVPAADARIEAGANLSADPRDTVVVDTALADDAIGRAPDDVARGILRRGALARSIQICGALEQALALTVTHVGSREQFGRPIGRFQAVQAMLAEAAEAVAMARTATDHAVNTVTEAGFDDDRSVFAIAVAKAQSSRAAPTVSRAAHQSHGAIGFTLDHRLRHFTLRALAWRAEFGGPGYWEGELGRAVLGEQRGNLWALITGLA